MVCMWFVCGNFDVFPKIVTVKYDFNGGLHSQQAITPGMAIYSS